MKLSYCTRGILLIVLALGGQSAFAQSESEIPVRFEMRETDNGLVRLDTRTGIVSLCTNRLQQLVCQPSIDGIKVYEDEITRLELENTKMRQELRQISEALATLTEKASIAAIKSETALDLSSTAPQEEGWFGKEEEKKLSDALDFTENAMRRFFSVVEEMKDDFQKDNAE
ncbi:hypothetical protein PsAD2_02445 [Pseudovibrio axinellae]|uniref:Uncharacterized protein n=1 Tax=Pseudovibrio axinellae TaxID=989403 RepID=A0A165YKR9_9HYPH|nr:hypothetical protein [Pseudovibrio axinellae]KZL18929.1 hypothetical protein PsAD2_02445 [Pseudovibrio axinellae]SEP87380.1 hypothetical protein SAMN05421798_101596 [Pseudovibrio axinellae]